VDAVRELRRERGLAAADVDAVECLVPPGEIPIICEPEAAKHRPRTAYDAKFSLPFAVAAALLDGHVGVASFAPERLEDERLLALARRVRYTPDIDSPFPRTFPGRVRVRTRDGRTLEARVEANRGGPEAPLTPAEVIAKFRDNAARALAPARIAGLEASVLEIGRATELRALLAHCRIG
jgi:2-methylcitrate dehydratase PrpD